MRFNMCNKYIFKIVFEDYLRFVYIYPYTFNDANLLLLNLISSLITSIITVIFANN